MNEKLPSVYAASINHDIKNSQETFYSALREAEVREVSPDEFIPLEAKINRIFNSDDFIYRKKVIIVTQSEEKEKIIIAKKGNYLLTIDNELIDIDSIKDIKF